MQVVIIGGGIVGLNIALALSESGQDFDVYLMEQEEFLGHHTSTRNSEVIHAGFAYPPDSLKTKLCIEGNLLTYELLEGLHVPYKRSGKWIVACDDVEVAALHRALDNAANCSVDGIEMTTLGALQRAVPEIQNVKEVAFSKTSGTLDVASYIKAIEIKLSNSSNVKLIYPCRVTGIDIESRIVVTNRGELNFDLLINSAGLEADDVYEWTSGQRSFQIVPFKGEYYTWPKGRIKEVVYPVPSRFLPVGCADATLTSSMGVHIHRSVTGDLYIGPSQIEGSPGDKYDYKIESRPVDFARDISRYIKGVHPDELVEAYAGNRPKAYKNGRPLGDFEIFRKGDIIHLIGMESPALTSAPAIARHVLALI